jgi:glycine cleavage system regulatory protein
MKDILFDFNAGTIFKNGDLNVGVSDDQNKNLLVINEKGSLKQFPDACVGAATYLEAEDTQGLMNETIRQFTGDGMKVKTIETNGSQLQVDANY